MAQVDRIEVTPGTVQGAARGVCVVQGLSFASVLECARDRAPDRLHERVVHLVAVRCGIDRRVYGHTHDRAGNHARSLSR